jgi:hypothetical protein
LICATVDESSWLRCTTLDDCGLALLLNIRCRVDVLERRCSSSLLAELIMVMCSAYLVCTIACAVVVAWRGLRAGGSISTPTYYLLYSYLLYVSTTYS